MNENMDEKLRDLLCDQAAFGLTEDETKKLAEFTKNANSSMDAQILELTAAAIALAELNLDEQMPSHLEARILSDAEKHFSHISSAVEIPENIHDMPTRNFQWVEPKPRVSFLNWFGWAVAAAACMALALNVYLTRGTTNNEIGAIKPTPSVEEKLSLAQMRERLIASVPDISRAEWAPGTIKELAISGDVVWSDTKQAGYARIKGLPVNDANKETYQLWIFDETQSEKTPIDGGVFNVTADGEVIITIDAKLKARNPKAFAITIEQPGGVVVSPRTKVAALAPVKPNQA